MFDWNNGTDFIVRIFVRSKVYKLTEEKDNVKIECFFFLNLLEGVEASNVINDPKCNKGPKCNYVWP